MIAMPDGEPCGSRSPDPADPHPLRPRIRARGGLVALAIALLVACHSIGTVPRQAWNERRFGPLVPHHTFPSDCSLCHVPERWDVLKPGFAFDHLAQTGVALEGAHATAACLRCHNDRGPVREFAVRGCGGCHVDPHEATLGADCTQCHDTTTWQPTGRIAEHARTRFPLSGAHAAAACDRCHEQARVGRFVGASIECVDCHQDDLAAASDPDHAALGDVRSCQRCHSPTAWSAAHYSHPSWPLQGRHRAAACADCHAGGIYSGTPRDCFSCHAADYAATSDPDHAAAGFGTTCEDCHTPIGWGRGGFDHGSAFPLTGPHALNCSDCHTTGTYPTFSCTHCHAHSKPEMDDEHDDVGGYSWSSPQCYACHPRGKE